MTETAEELSELEARALCADCIGDAFLKDEVERIGESSRCHYCGKVGMTASIGDIARYVDMAFEHHFQRTPPGPSSLEYAMEKEGDYVWERKGERVVWAIAEAAGIDDEPANDMREVLAEKHFDMEDIGEEGPFDEDTYYAPGEPDDREYQQNWYYFERSLKTEVRFLSKTGEATLDEVFEELADHRTPDGKAVIVEAGPETKIASLYRARVFQSTRALDEALKRPDLHVGPPPADKAKPGRMNAHGISVFYGATDPAVAVAEVRPPVGSHVIVGKFVPLRRLRLLDVDALQSVYVSGSVFDPAVTKRWQRAKFLEHLGNRFARPVMPDDEALEYLVTQVIADYLADRSDCKLDGILYPSVQDGAGGRNVMLFHKASRVTPMDIPKRTKLYVQAPDGPDDETEFDYAVWEEVPPDEREEGQFPEPLADSCRFAGYTFESADDDSREPTLQLDAQGLGVRRIVRAKYGWDVHGVRRQRIDLRDVPF